MKNEVFYYSKNLIIEIIKTYKNEFIEDLEKAYNEYFINPLNSDMIYDLLVKYIIEQKNIPDKTLTEEEEYSLEFEKENYREYKYHYNQKNKVKRR